MNLGMVHYGMGLHIATLSQYQVTKILKLLMAFECVYCTAVAIVKISLLLMYCRIFPLRGFTVAAWILGSIAVAWAIAINCVSIFQCNPIRKGWLPWLPYGHCINLKKSFIGNAVPNILTDVAILSMPIPQVWKLNATTAQRVSIICVFLLGTFVLFASIYRFVTVFNFNPEDVSWTLAKACTWCVVEVASGIISTCLPTLRPLLRMVSTQFSSGVKSKTKTRTGDLATVGGSGARNLRGSNSHFHRLNDLVLRPQKDDKLTTTILQSEGRDDSDSDGIPLNNIHVRTSVEWHEGSRHGHAEIV
ncbi:MAG: hypothetical protein M1819_005059 [Sarea resinae]|nr:MAG: hypothetical protein M1819_005059 [Sarea resinae]